MTSGRYHIDPERKVLKPEQWPDHDRELWQSSLTPSDPFSDQGSRAHLRAISNDKVAKGHGRFLNYIQRHHPQLFIGQPAERLTPIIVKAYVEHLRSLGNSDHTLLDRLQELASMGKVLAPSINLAFIKRIEARIRSRARPARDKKGRVIATDELVALGLDLMATASTQSTPRLQAIQYRDGLVIAFLALRPWRRKNIAAMQLHKNLIRHNESWMIVLSADETKTHQHDIRSWPEELTSQLETYLAIHRPILMSFTGRWTAPVDDYLWVSSESSPQTQMSIYQQICKRTRTAFGIAVNPHMFRDAAATTLAMEDPTHVRISARILGHRSFKTTETYYQQAEQKRAHQAYTDHLAQVRGKPKRRSARKSGE